MKVFFIAHQLDMMLIMIGICLILSVLAYLTKSLSKKRKAILMAMELGAMFLLIFDRYAYIFRGDISTLGYWMVRISNFMVFFLALFLEGGFDMYLIDLYSNEGGLKKLPRRLYICLGLVVMGELLLVISQFTGLYYTFDEFNRYHRSEFGYYICYMIPLILLILFLTVIIQNYKRLSRLISLSLLVFTIVPIIASVAQVFLYGLSLNNLAVVAVVVLLYIFALSDMNTSIERANRLEIEYLKTEQREMQELFEQTAEALASAIDAKDKYTHGHSTRVAEYSRKIAQLAGKNDDECQEIYFSALLHDVGKIGVPDVIINKDGKLTDAEFAEIKKHPVIGKQILSSINQSPYLSIGANFHHERYDGRGYPLGLKGDDIPEIARIIAVADAYDAMTSKRSYRDPIPQHKVREEIVKGSGTQFDPQFAKLMLHLIDTDEEYEMQERGEIKELAGKNSLYCREYKEDISEGILLDSHITRIRLQASTAAGYSGEQYIPSLVIFDSLDGRFHDEERKIKDMMYLEYAEIRFDGIVKAHGARKTKTDISEYVPVDTLNREDINARGVRYDIEAVRYKDHILIKIKSSFGAITVTIALNDSSRFAYLSLTGEHCDIRKVAIDKAAEEIDANHIPRIAEEISYINVPAGDIPNVQVDGWCSATSKPVLIQDKMRFNFHAMSLPTARLIWHCPYMRLFTSEDGKIGGPGYRELILVRLDGENWDSDDKVENEILVQKDEEFTNWDAWKELNKKGMDCEINVTRKDNKITVRTRNGGIDIKSVTTIEDEIKDIYAVLTGDQVAITNIRISG